MADKPIGLHIWIGYYKTLFAVTVPLVKFPFRRGKPFGLFCYFLPQIPHFAVSEKHVIFAPEMIKKATPRPTTRAQIRRI